MSILGPAWLVKQIPNIALILGAVSLVIFSDFMNRKFVFPIADYVRDKTHHKLSNWRKEEWTTIAGKYLSEALATIVFISYCFLGSLVLAEFIFGPILQRLKGVIVIVVIALFILISWVINNRKIRDMFMQV